MGCDIHCFAEYKIKGRWHYALEIDISRRYDLFARMAECGREIDTVPLVPNRGIPEDADFMTKFYMEHKADHSFSWLDAKQVMQLFQEFGDFQYDGYSLWYDWKKYPDTNHWGIEDFRWVFGFDN